MTFKKPNTLNRAFESHRSAQAGFVSSDSNKNSKKCVAFMAPQGEFGQENSAYMKAQGSTAECGGQVIYVIESAKAIAEQGHEVHIFARNYKDGQIRTETVPGYSNIKVHHIPTSAPHSIEKENFYPYYAESLARTCQFVDQTGLKFDYIAGHYIDGMTMAAGLEKHIDNTTGKKTPLIGFTHSIGLNKVNSFLKNCKISSLKKFYDEKIRCNSDRRAAFELAIFDKMDGIVAISKDEREVLTDIHMYDESRINIIPGGVNENVFFDINQKSLIRRFTKALSPKRWENMIQKDKISLIENTLAHRADISDMSREYLKNGDIILGFGRLVDEKGVYNAVQSMEHTLKENPDAVYVYAGGNVPPKEGTEEHKLYERCMNHAKEKGYADRVVFLGRQDQKDINKWLDVSSVYLHTAHLEPFGLALLEAALTSIPTVISKEAGAAEFLENDIHTLHTDPKNPKDISKQILRLLQNNEFATRLSKNAATKIKAEGTWEYRAKQMMDFFTGEVQSYFHKRAEKTPVHNPLIEQVGSDIPYYKTTIPYGLQSYYRSTKEILEDLLNPGKNYTAGPLKETKLPQALSAIEYKFVAKDKAHVPT